MARRWRLVAFLAVVVCISVMIAVFARCAIARKPPEAEQSFRRDLSADPTNADAAFNLSVLVSRTSLDEAIALCPHGVLSRPADPKFAYTLALQLVHKGDLSAAAAVLERRQTSSIPCDECDRLLAQIRAMQSHKQHR